MAEAVGSLKVFLPEPGEWRSPFSRTSSQPPLALLGSGLTGAEVAGAGRLWARANPAMTGGKKV
ncbi:MAG TPA: hypothetical protein V6D02_13230 [Candidatus Obscuribacterales bacterium]